MASKKFFSHSNKPKSRRQDRARRQDSERLWRDGQLDENEIQIERWSRERKNPAPKVSKKDEAFILSHLQNGLIMQVHRRSAMVLNSDGDIEECLFGPKISRKISERPAVGDRVQFASGNELVAPLVWEVLPRRNKLSRPGPEDRKSKELVLAANIDRIVIVMTLSEPNFNSRLLDRYLCIAEKSSIDCCLVLNKMDICDQIPEEIYYLQKLGYQLITCSAKSNAGIDELADYLKDQIVVFTGPSGVGKSSLTNALGAKDKIKEGANREGDGKGRHTTTSAQLHDLDHGIRIVDTPGIRELGLWHLAAEEVAYCFREFRPLLSKCHFRDCSHLNEKGCAIRQAVKELKIPYHRLDSFERICESL